MKINCIIIEDSSIQRLIIAKFVNSHINLNLLGEFPNAIEAKNFLSYNDVELVFLDIEMPVLSGFDFLDIIKSKPQIIFITSKPEYAVKAFDYDATDYLQKPITRERFEAAIKRAINLQLLKSDNPDEGSYIFIKSKLKKLKVFTSRIKWVEAFGDYVKVVTEDEQHMVLSTMKAFTSELPANKFIRVHKSYIVNIDKIDRLNSKYAEIGEDAIPLSRNRKEELKKALEI
ncbi:MAG TPA: LytTR family DNA-binding domain-containing protein [Flavobacterium sp.]|jgi:DNA-binding LytR/AlgR family response regulator